MYENIKHLNQLGFSNVQMRFVRSNNRLLSFTADDIDLLKFQLGKYIKYIFEAAINGDDSLLRMISNEHDYVGKMIHRICLRKKYLARCMAGSYMFSFATDGSIYPCDSFVGKKSFIIGNYYKGFYKNKLNTYKDLTIYRRSRCKNCWARFVCGGDCYHNSYIVNKNLLEPDPTYCVLIKYVIENVIAYSNRFQKYNKLGYDNFVEFLFIRDQYNNR